MSTPKQKKSKSPTFQASWAAPIILQNGGTQYGMANGTAAIPLPATVTSSQSNPAQSGATSPKPLQWKNPKNGRGWYTGGYELPKQPATTANATATGTAGAKAASRERTPSETEKAAQKRAEQRARKSQERASKRMCMGVNNSFLDGLCNGLPFCTPQSRGEPHDEAIIDGLLDRETKQEGERGLWNLVTDLFSGGNNVSSTPVSPKRTSVPLPAHSDMPPLGLTPDRGFFGSVSATSPTHGLPSVIHSPMQGAHGDSPFDEISDMDVALTFEGVHGYSMDASQPADAFPPSISAVSSSATVLHGHGHLHSPTMVHETLPPDFIANAHATGSVPLPPSSPHHQQHQENHHRQQQQQQQQQQLLPSHPHSLMASGGYAGEANQSGSDASLDSIALMDLYEDATRQDYEDAVRSKSTAHQKGGGSIDSGGRPANRDATNEASGGVGQESAAHSFTLEWGSEHSNGSQEALRLQQVVG